MATLQEINTRAQKIRKASPKMKWNNAQKEAARQLRGISGVKKKAAPKKKTVVKTTKVVRIGAVAKKKTVTRVTGSTVQKGEKIINAIARYETKLKATKGKEARGFLIAVINAEHDKLDNLKQALKR